jgi:hypothetical protein
MYCIGFLNQAVGNRDRGQFLRNVCCHGKRDALWVVSKCVFRLAWSLLYMNLQCIAHQVDKRHTARRGQVKQRFSWCVCTRMCNIKDFPRNQWVITRNITFLSNEPIYSEPCSDSVSRRKSRTLPCKVGPIDNAWFRCLKISMHNVYSRHVRSTADHSGRAV